MQDWLTAYKIPLGKWIASFVEFLNDHAAFAFNAVSDGLGFLIDGLIDLMLAHVPEGVSGSEGAYNRAAFLLRRREIAEAWGSMLLGIFPEPAKMLGWPSR